MAGQFSEPKPRAGTFPTLADKRRFLESGAAWAGEAPPACVETHASLIFLTSDRAWKLKKPVRLHHIDLSTLEARAHYCREEFRLNRELAGEVYRAVAPLVLRPDGGLAIGGGGRIVDWLIEMRRLPEARMLDRLIAEGPPPAPAEVAGAAEVLLRFYARAPGDPGAGAVYLERLRTEGRTNARHLRGLWSRIGWPGDRGILDRGTALLEAAAGEILSRGRRGLLVEGHGDLRPEHLCLEEPPVIFDRVEFDHAARLVDPFEELGYLGLECAMLGAGWVRETLLAAVDRAGVPRPSEELALAYGVNRCLTRARLAIDHLRDVEIRTPEKWPAQARRYLEAAARIAGGEEPAGPGGADQRSSSQAASARLRSS